MPKSHNVDEDEIVERNRERTNRTNDERKMGKTEIKNKATTKRYNSLIRHRFKP